MYKLTRNQVFAAGMLLLLLGGQLRVVDQYVLTKEATQTIAKVQKKTDDSPMASITPSILAAAPMQKTVSPPEWIGWALISVGAVLVMHAVSMPKPGG